MYTFLHRRGVRLGGGRPVLTGMENRVWKRPKKYLIQWAQDQGPSLVYASEGLSKGYLKKILRALLPPHPHTQYPTQPAAYAHSLTPLNQSNPVAEPLVGGFGSVASSRI